MCDECSAHTYHLVSECLTLLYEAAGTQLYAPLHTRERFGLGLRDRLVPMMASQSEANQQCPDSLVLRAAICCWMRSLTCRWTWLELSVPPVWT